MSTATEFTSIGFGNGFPFMLDAKSSRMETQGIDQNKNVVVNNFWNLKRVELSFIIETDKYPDIYLTGWIEDEIIDSSDNIVVLDRDPPDTAGEVKCEYDVISTLDNGAYEPQDRNFPIRPGEETQDLDGMHFISGSGHEHTAFAVTNEVDFYMPFTLQPQNSGAFIITSDSGVAGYYGGKNEFDAYKEFDIVPTLDLGTGSDGASDKRDIPAKQWYIVPAAGWEFTVTSAYLDAQYYSY
jgi:hypothetical protein